MEPINEILVRLLSQQTMRVEFPGLDMERLEQAMAQKGFSLLLEIQSVLADDALSDFDCVEKLVRIFEREDIPCGSRHDFG